MKEDKLGSIIVYTDGSCDPNPGPGGWAALIISGEKEEMISGSSISSTNNRMELTAAIEALRSLKNTSTHPILLFTDSLYLKKGVMEWMDNWKARNWKRKGGKLANVDLWKQLSGEIENRPIKWQWVRAHAGTKNNEMVDRKARQMARSVLKKR